MTVNRGDDVLVDYPTRCGIALGREDGSDRLMPEIRSRSAVNRLLQSATGMLSLGTERLLAAFQTWLGCLADSDLMT